ncbi:MAG TPA: glycosyltransferase [Ignavibacteriaceae bacterium]|nr:glycosyltransferase [Ignavibacteriaceae bacterium]
MLKILHLAPQNYAGVPYDFYKMHNSCGDYSRLITYHKNPLDFPEDICLKIPLPNFNLVKKWRKSKVNEVEIENPTTYKFFKPHSVLEKIYFDVNDYLKYSVINDALKKYNLDDFGIIHYDAGLDFFRNASQAKRWKQMGKKIVCCYYGSDLRIRGVIKELDEISDLNITSEYDHLFLKPDLKYLFYPYDISELPKKNKIGDVVKIVHTPTNRKYKGTNLIIEVITKLKKEKKFEFILLENTPRKEVLRIKSTCDICIDQVGGSMGGTGYGKAGLETLGMGLPTITNMTEEYRKWLPENPFVVANNADELYNKLNELIDNEELRKRLGEAGKKWVKKYHGFESVNKKLYELYKENNIIE